MEWIWAQWGAAVHSLLSQKMCPALCRCFGKVVGISDLTLAPGGWRDYGMGPGMMWGWWGMGWIFMIIMWGIFIVGVIFLIRYLMGATKVSRDAESALEILKKRYARGEINKEEFEEKKRDLL